MKKITTILCLFGLFTVFGCEASQQQEDYSNYKKASVTAALFMSEAATKLGGDHPQKQLLYGLNLCVVFQKVPKGYLLVSEDPAPWGDIHDPLFLETNEELGEGQNLMFREAYYVGDFNYTGINGFNKKIYAFKLVPRFTENSSVVVQQTTRSSSEGKSIIRPPVQEKVKERTLDSYYEELGIKK